MILPRGFDSTAKSHQPGPGKEPYPFEKMHGSQLRKAVERMAAALREMQEIHAHVLEPEDDSDW